MNKKSLLSLCLFAASTALSFTAVHIMSLFDVSKWMGLTVGLSLLITTLMLEIMNACAFKNRKGIHVVAIAVNAIADGIASSSLFVHLGEYPQLWQTVVIFVVTIAAFAIYLLITYTPFARNHFISSIGMYIVIICAAALSCLLSLPKALAACSLALLYMAVFISFFVSLPIAARDMDEHIKHIAYCSFAALAAVIVIVLIVIMSQGDFDIPDFLSGGTSDKDKKRNPYKYKR